MTWLDRLLVGFARFALGLVQRRFSTAHGRVWWWNVSSTRPRADRWPDLMPAAIGRISFGGSVEGEALLVLRVEFTREMFDVFVDGQVETRRAQDGQLADLRRAGKLPPVRRGPLGL